PLECKIRAALNNLGSFQGVDDHSKLGLLQRKLGRNSFKRCQNRPVRTSEQACNVARQQMFRDVFQLAGGWKPLPRQKSVCALGSSRVQKDCISFATVATGSTGFLDVGLHRTRVVVVEDETNLLLVHAHAEGIRRYDHLDLALHEELLNVVTFGGGQSG